MKTVDPLLKNEYSKRVYTRLGLRKPFATQKETLHYRMPLLQENGGYALMPPYSGPEIPSTEWTELEYTTPPTDPTTWFAPLASANGENILRGFWDFGKPDLDGVWTPNAAKAPGLVRYVNSLDNRFGRLQLIRQDPTSLRQARWGLHLDDNNRLNPMVNGWVVRLWLQLTDDPDSALVLRRDQFDRSSEVQIPLRRGTQVMVDSEALFHSGYHKGPNTRYALIISLESTEHLDDWMRSQLP
jgi:hypothetical protein